MTRARMIAMLREFFVNREMEVSEGGDLDLVVNDANNVIGVKVVFSPFTREEVERLLVSDAVDRYDKVYVAVPSRYAALLPPLDVLRAAGIGVLEVGREGVVERVAAPPRRRRLVRGAGDVAADVQRLREEVERLKVELERLRVEVSRIEALEKRVRRLEAVRARPTAATVDRGVEPKPGEVAGGEEVEGVPSFAVDNPWLKLLSRRGGE